MKFTLVGLVSVTAVVVTWLVIVRAPDRSSAESPTRQVATLLAVDNFGGGHDGNIQGLVKFGLPGYDDATSYSFEERGAWILVPSAAPLNPVDQDFLVSAWVNLDDSPDSAETYDVVRKGISFTSPGEFKLGILPFGRVRCTARDQYQREVTATSRRARDFDGDWHRIGCARTGSMWSVIVDDAIETRLVALGSVASTVAMYIGSKYGFEDRSAGRVDDVKLIIDRESVSREELYGTELTTAVRRLEELPPVGWWRLDEAATSVYGR